jgi:excisionase family DNA binding protein
VVKEILTTEEVAGLLKCTPETVETAARNRKLAGVKYGRVWVFPMSALVEALHRQAMANVADAVPAIKAPDAVPTAAAVSLPAGRRLAANSRIRPRPILPSAY